MPKTIAITPSHYWPRGIPRTFGIPRLPIRELGIERWNRQSPKSVLLSDGTSQITATELATRVKEIAAALEASVPEGSNLIISTTTTLEGVLLTLGALVSRRATILYPSIDQAFNQPRDYGACIVTRDLEKKASKVGLLEKVLYLDDLLSSRSNLDPTDTNYNYPNVDAFAPSVGFGEHPRIAWHSDRNILSHALSLRLFIGDKSTGPVISALSPCTWQGLMALTSTLISGHTFIPTDSTQLSIETLTAFKSQWLFCTSQDAVSLFTPAGKRGKGETAGLAGILVDVGESFDPSAIRAITKSQQCPTLSFFGTPETGPIIGSHPSWYIAESVGLPLPNVHMIPTDPRTKAPIGSLWELVEAALIAVWSPSVMLGYQGEQLHTRDHAKQFLTNILAGSDPNGMLYLLD